MPRLPCRAGRFEEALRLAHATYEGPALAKRLERVTGALAAAAVRAQHAQHRGASSGPQAAAAGAGGALFGACPLGPARVSSFLPPPFCVLAKGKCGLLTAAATC